VLKNKSNKENMLDKAEANERLEGVFKLDFGEERTKECGKY
jgi:hypothetical protein